GREACRPRHRRPRRGQPGAALRSRLPPRVRRGSGGRADRARRGTRRPRRGTAHDRRRARDPPPRAGARDRDRVPASARQLTNAPDGLAARVGSASWAFSTVTVEVPLLLRKVGGLLPTSSSLMVCPAAKAYALPSSWKTILPFWFG